MNAIPNGVIESEKNNTDVVHGGEDEIVEVGAVVADTKGSWFGNSVDNGQGFFIG